jgi:Tol biopolymer transport system component
MGSAANLERPLSIRRMQFMSNRLAFALALITLSAALPLAAQQKGKSDLPLTPTRRATFTTDEGTWVSLDVSPDGNTIVFELLGDIYTIPKAGGKATRITSGLPYDWAPRYSPDGKSIVFVSDRSGTQNVWIADADGSHARALTTSPANQYMSPEWTPDGKYIVVGQAARRFSPYELFLIDTRGGSGVKLSQARQSHTGPAFGKDPRYLYYTTGYGSFGSWQVERLDRLNSHTSSVTSARGSGMRPVLSPDGRYLVYATRRDAVTSLILRDLTTGDQKTLVAEVARDEQERLDQRDLMPGSSFTPDSKALVTSYGGKIWRVEVPSGQASVIPFSADVDLELGPLVQVDYPHNDSTLTARQIRDARPSPDGKRLTFVALDRLWVADLEVSQAAGAPAQIRNARRLTNGTTGEFSPVWSPRGDYIAFVSWGELEGGGVHRVAAAGGVAERITSDNAFYDNLNFTPDGSRLVANRIPRGLRLATTEARGPSHSIDLVWMLGSCSGSSSQGCAEPRVISPLSQSAFPHFTRDTTRIYITQGDQLISMRWDGTDRKSHLKVTGRGFQSGGSSANEILISPEGDQAVALVDNNIFLVSVPPVGGQLLTFNAYGGPVPARRLSRVGGEFPGWRADGREVHYSLGKSYFRYDVAAAEAAIRDSTIRAANPDTTKKSAPDTAKKADTATKKPSVAYEAQRFDVMVTVPKDKPKGGIALRGARIITMKGKEVIENGDIVIRDNRIAAVGKRGSVTIPGDAKIMDVKGATIIPGWVDVHAHMWTGWGVHRSQVWEYLANLAYGVTATRDPQTSTSDVVTYGDLVEMGSLLGPRVYGTGVGVGSPSQDDITSLDAARDVLRRYSEFWQTETIKQYSAGDRKVRQWVIMAARELGLMPTTEGSGEMEKDLTVMIDGYPGQEHNFTVWPVFKDVIELTAKTGITYTPTILVDYNAPEGKEYFFTRFDIHDDAKLRRFTPHSEIDQKSLRRSMWVREDQFGIKGIAADAAKIIAAGGRIGLGGHGELQGLGVHWELQALASGGMPLHDLLRVGTILGAEAIGHGKDFGSLEVGKLADLQVLDKNPLQDVRNTLSIRYVMKNGRLYDANTLDEIWPRAQKLGPLWWQESTSVGSKQ